MNFDFSEDQQLVREQTARFLRERCDSTVVRSVLEGKAAYAEPVWRGLAEMGLVGTSIPESYGGAGAGYLELCLIARELGAALAPVPFGSTVYLLTEALLLWGSDQQKSRWLPAIAAGDCKGALALVETREQTTPESISTRYADGTLNGSKLIVPDGGIADLLVVVARAADGGLGLYLVDVASAAVQRQEVSTVDPTRNSASIEFVNTPAEPLGAPGQGWEALQTLNDRAAVLYAFEQLGGAERALEMGVGYARERFAFGRPIGSFQAIKHMLADMYVTAKLAESNCYYAAWALSTGSADLPLAAATARVSATQAFQQCSKDNIQVHGGMGFTWEFDCHLYYRRSNFLALELGGLTVWEDRLVQALEPTANQQPTAA
ncbi:MAG: acyl-CoA dehydrogenase family protein [Pseudomonadales bacterium]